MKVYELTLKVFLLKDIRNDESLEKIANLIDKSLARDSELLSFHKENTYKKYNFNSFYPIEKNKIYCQGKIYSIQIRTVDEKLVKYFKKNLVNEYTNYIKALTLECRIIPQRYIEKLYSITPCIIKSENGYWKGNLSIEEFEKRIVSNLIKKYNSFFNTKIDEKFILFRTINFQNNKPISCKYKNINILGDKVTLIIDENEMAQKLAYFSLGAGVGEMNARGYGYNNYQYL